MFRKCIMVTYLGDSRHGLLALVHGQCGHSFIVICFGCYARQEPVVAALAIVVQNLVVFGVGWRRLTGSFGPNRFLVDGGVGNRRASDGSSWRAFVGRRGRGRKSV